MINLWNPIVTGDSLLFILLLAFLLGVVHGLTPDEHTWPITFSYSINSYSSKRGFITGLVFSLFFTLQRMIASEIFYFFSSSLLQNEFFNYSVYILIGIVMIIGGIYILKLNKVFHIHIVPNKFFGVDLSHNQTNHKEINYYFAALHGFIAGWGTGAFALIVYTVLVPATNSPFLAFLPGLFFGIGTTLLQASAGFLFGKYMETRKIGETLIRSISNRVAGRTLFYGGIVFMLSGFLGVLFPDIVNGIAFNTGIKIHNLDHIGIDTIIVIVVVLFIGIGSLIFELGRIGKKQKS